MKSSEVMVKAQPVLGVGGKTRLAAKHIPLAQHSDANMAWGTPPILRRFAVCVLRPASMGTSAIDLDYASSTYWQAWWNLADRPREFLDGTKGRNVLVEADRRAVGGRLGAGFLNPPGLGGGSMIQECWKIFEQDHREEKLGSGFYQGFSVESFGSLQNVGERNPLTTDVEDLITTIVPSRRAHYVLPPEQLIALTLKKQKRREKRSKQWWVEQRLLDKLRSRTDDAPVDGGAPSHLSFTTILWHRARAVRHMQMEAAQLFLKEQQADPKSLFHRFEAIGPLDMEGRKVTKHAR